MIENIEKRLGNGVFHILYGVGSILVAILDGIALLTIWGIEQAAEQWERNVWPFFKEYGPKAARGVVSVSIVSVNYTTITLAALLERIRG
ncbi:hypothetical protein [Haloarcula laminariae]|uniref:hypothetical protein n=1 Tax=Haloarcula laminariae TaxID=2961577 RepID=UPI0024070849|nr:hypothetical protein [Halomicroarcula sp. FL173]